MKAEQEKAQGGAQAQPGAASGAADNGDAPEAEDADFKVVD